jgi:hypothetical protein
MLKVTNHCCNRIPKGCAVFHVDGDKKYLFRILESILIDVNYCPYCGEELKGAESGEP